MKHLLWMLGVVSLAGSGVASAQAPGTINFPTSGQVAYFSPQRVFSGSTEGKKAIARLTALEAERSGTITEKNKALEAERQAFRERAPTLSESVRNARTKELEKFEIDARRLFEDAQAELMGIQRETEAAFLAKLKPIVAQVIKEKNLIVLFNEDLGTIAWADPALDLTPEFIKRLDAATEPNKTP